MNNKTSKLPQTIMFVAVIGFLIFTAVISICVGQYSISPEEIAQIITGGLKGEMSYKVFFTLRLPRVLMAVMAGIGLGIAGSVYQTIFKNPLASPDIIGVAPGANLGAAIAIVFMGASTVAMVSGAFTGGIAVVILVMLLVRVLPGNTTATYVLAGIVMSSVSKAFIMILKFFADPANELAAIEFWTMGSFASVTSRKVITIFPIFFFSLAGLILLRRQIELMSLNEDECRMLGVRLSQIRITILALSTLMVASIISITGLISFIGLIAPHIARMMLKRNNFAATAMSGLIGAVVMVISDTLARCVYSAEIPISILTTFIGVPVLVYFMYQQKENLL